MTNSDLEQRLAREPIAIPGSPFWDALKSFGRDEALAMVINIVGTVGVDFALQRDLLGTFGEEEQRVILTFAGPVIEKFGFFPAHLKEAYDIYQTTPADQRDPYSHYVALGLKNGSKSLLKDILIHDPLYAVMMYSGLHFNSGTPAWMIATVSFIGAVFAVAGLDVAYDETKYWKLQRKARKAGWGIEDYFESRFLIDERIEPEKIVEGVMREFSLSDQQRGEYHDRYFESLLPELSKRVAKVRLRERQLGEENTFRTAQIVYTRAGEIAQKNPQQFRYFPVEKRKIYFALDQEMPQSVDQIKDARAKDFLNERIGSALNEIRFTRLIAKNPELLVAADCLDMVRPFNVVELKTRTDTKLLQEAMRYVMLTYPVLQTTYGKADLRPAQH